MEIIINKNEVLRYLGYRDQHIDDELKNLINECREEVRNAITPKYVYDIFDIKTGNEVVYVENTNLLLKGDAINKHLSKSKNIALLVVTLGNNIEKVTRLYEKSNLTKALIIDACATTAIEEICDYVESLVKEIAEKNNENITFRFSPGYGDLPLDTQKDFIKVMDASRKIGVTVSDHDILFPRKSVTAIIGFIPKTIKNEKKSCRQCNHYENCKFRREGTGCGI